MGNQAGKLRLQLTKRQILLHHAFKMKIQIDQLSQFPHGLDGLKLWQAGIVLSRFIIIHSQLFKGKTVLQLGSGVGIAGMTAKKWTACKQVTMSDYNDNIIKQCQHNCRRNGFIVNHSISSKSKNAKEDDKNQMIRVIKLDWRMVAANKQQVTKDQYPKKEHIESEPQKMEGQLYDIIMGSDIVYFGCPVKDLYIVFKKLLKPGGIGIIIIPDRKNYAELFLELIQSQIFQVKKQKLNNQQYRQPALQDQIQSKKQYSLLTEIDFYVYYLFKK